MERTFPAGLGDERAVLTGWLDWQRATVRRKVEGLSDADSRRVLLPTSPRLTASGVVSHLRWTERNWFAASFPSDADGQERSDGDGWDVAPIPLVDLLQQYDAECVRSREIVARHGLETVQELTPPQFAPVTLRWILTHLIEETARHLGHLDVLREHIDGVRGY